VAVSPCSKRSQAPVELEHLYRRAKQDMMSALRQTSLISQGLPPNRRRSRQSLESQIHCPMWLQRNMLPHRGEARNFQPLSFSHPERQSHLLNHSPLSLGLILSMPLLFQVHQQTTIVLLNLPSQPGRSHQSLCTSLPIHSHLSWEIYLRKLAHPLYRR
jgi:hypothetical protein